jgi:uncharacterized protein YkwD
MMRMTHPMKKLVGAALLTLAVLGLAAPAPAESLVGVLTESAIVRQTNLARQRAGVAPLRFNPLLNQVARAYAMRMAREDRMSHTLGGQDAAARLTAAGYHFRAWGENITWNYHDATAVMQGWMNSPGHRKNILDPTFTEIGVGVAYNARGQPYYCQVFARPAGPGG